MTTTDDNIRAADLELDRLAWNLPDPPEREPDEKRPWPPWPFRSEPEEDRADGSVEPEQAA